MGPLRLQITPNFIATQKLARGEETANSETYLSVEAIQGLASMAKEGGYLTLDEVGRAAL